MKKSVRFTYLTALALAPCGTFLLDGCGGGGGGNDNSNATPGPSSTPSGTAGPSPTPTATSTPGPSPTPIHPTLIGNYQSAIVPSGQIPNDSRTPTQQFQITNQTATTNFTYYVPQSVINTVQAQINDGLRKAGVGFAIPQNQLPKSIAVTGTGKLDGNGKLVFAVSQTVNVCGNARLTLDPTFTINGNSVVGTGNYRIDFPNNLTMNVLGRKISTSGTCNNLPLRTGKLTLTK